MVFRSGRMAWPSGCELEDLVSFDRVGELRKVFGSRSASAHARGVTLS